MGILNKINFLCKKHNATLAGLERELGFSKGSIHKWDVNNPSIDKIKKVADYFDVSTDFLLGRPTEHQFAYMIQRFKEDTNVSLDQKDIKDIYNFVKFKYSEALKDNDEDDDGDFIH